MRALKIFSFSVLVLAGVSCDKATPIAPSDTVITLAANPAEIAIDGQSEITITARRENGSPVNTGTQVRLSTTLGKLDAEVLETDVEGFVSTTLRSDGRIGQADLIARSGAASSDAVMVQIGRLAGSVNLQASPSSVTESGGTINLLALVRDSQGQPLPNVPVNFSADIGVLASQGQFSSTNSSGQATDVLTVTATDIEALGANQFSVTFEASTTGGSVTSDTANITIFSRLAGSVSLQATPASVTESGGTVALQALVRDSQGQPLPDVPVNFTADIGSLASGGQFQTTDSVGQATDRLDVSATDIEALAGDQFRVTFEASGVGGDVVSDSVDVSILRKPIASFSRSVTQFTVVFTDTSDNVPTSWRWTFGDGSTVSTQRSPTHVYSSAGTFVVTLTVTNSAGSDSTSQAVTVPNV